jgi:hypothetical protein
MYKFESERFMNCAHLTMKDSERVFGGSGIANGRKGDTNIEQQRGWSSLSIKDFYSRFHSIFTPQPPTPLRNKPLDQ